MFGGGIRQPGMMAAAASAAFDHAFPLFPKVHALTASAAKRVVSLGYKLALPVQTNMIVIDMEESDIPGGALVNYCEQQGVIAFSSGRLVFHHQTSEEGVRRLLLALTKLMEDKKAGKVLEEVEVNGVGYA